MSFKDNTLAWLSSSGAYWIITLLWIITIIVFVGKAKEAGNLEGSSNSGCYLMISTTIFVGIGGSIGLVLFQKFFPWYILTALAGGIIAPALVIRTFKSGKRKY